MTRLNPHLPVSAVSIKPHVGDPIVSPFSKPDASRVQFQVHPETQASRAPQGLGFSAIQPRDHASLTAVYAALNQVRTEIKEVRGWHGSRLAVSLGFIGGMTLVAGIAVATVLTGGAALVGVAVAVGGASVILAGGVGGLIKTQRAKNHVRNQPALMKKVQLLRQAHEKLAPCVTHRKSAHPVELRLFTDIGNTLAKVDRSSLKEAGKMAAWTAGGTALGGVAIGALVGLVALFALSDGGGDMGCIAWFDGPTLLPDIGTFSHLGGQELYVPASGDGQPVLTQEEVEALRRPAV